MRRYSILLGLVLTMTCGVADAAQPTEFGAILDQYEGIRLALLHDTIEGVADRADAIFNLTGATEDANIGACSETDDELCGILNEVREQAAGLRSVASIEESRDAFGRLSQVLVKFRQHIGGPESVVVYCSMAEKLWLQPKGEIGNPYYGQDMAQCGEIVSE